MDLIRARKLANNLIGKHQVRKLEKHGIITIFQADLKDLLADLEEIDIHLKGGDSE